MEEGDNDNEAKLIQSGGGAPNTMFRCLNSFAHTQFYALLNVGTHTHRCARAHTLCECVFSHSGEDVAIKSTFRKNIITSKILL